MKNGKVSLTAQNRLIISGLVLSTILIICIAIFAIFNIQNKLNEGYQSFGRVISKALAVEYSELSLKMPTENALNTVETHADTILKGHSDILYIKINDQNGKQIYLQQSKLNKPSPSRNITVTSQILNSKGSQGFGTVTVAFSGNVVDQISATTRASLNFCIFNCLGCFCFVVLMVNTYLITRELRILKEGVSKISSGEFGYTD
jgi:hypothetical protein